MQTIILSTFIATLLIFTSRTSNKSNSLSKEGIAFYEGSFDSALQLAEKENKLVFLNIYASWCGPCKRMKSKTFTDIEVGTFYNENFINLTLNGEEGEGLELAKKYGVRSYPGLLFINSKGEVITAISRFHNPKKLIELGKTALK